MARATLSIVSISDSPQFQQVSILLIPTPSLFSAFAKIMGLIYYTILRTSTIQVYVCREWVLCSPTSHRRLYNLVRCPLDTLTYEPSRGRTLRFGCSYSLQMSSPLGNLLSIIPLGEKIVKFLKFGDNRVTNLPLPYTGNIG